MSFRLKLLACFVTLLAAVLGSALFLIDRAGTRRAEESILAGLESARQGLTALLEARQRQLATNLGLLSGDFAFKQAVATGDPDTVFSAAQNHKARIRADALIVLDGEGKVLADTRRKAKPGKSLSQLKVFRSAADGKEAATIQLLDGRPYQLAAVPLNAPDLIGVLIAGFEIDDELARKLKAMTRTDIAFADAGGIFASTLPPERRKSLEPRVMDAVGRARIVPLAGERFLTLAERQGPDVTVVLMRSWDEALEPARQMQRLLLSVGLAGIAVTIVLGTLLASGVTRSLRQLVAASQKLAKGQFDVSVDIRSKDEIAELGDAFNGMARGMLERDKVKSVLRKAVSKEIAEALLAKGQIELGGEEKTVTVLFSDIRSFTTISEGLEPKELVSQLNAYFIRMARAIDQHHGVIDKFVGDAIMALFGAPLPTEGDAANAVSAALEMARALEELNAERVKAGQAPWRNGIGLNTGTAVAGTLGSEDRWSYTVIGDSVNLASRLEGLTKHYGVQVIVSESTRQAAPGFAYRALDRVVVKGRQEPVQIFEALGEGAAPAWLPRWDEASAAYRARKWDEAERAFADVLVARPDDGAAKMYLERAKTMQLKPSAADPDEPTRMTEK